MTFVKVDTNEMDWENGLDVVESMAPEFKPNLGPADQIEAVYVKYNQKSLRNDPDTKRRFDLIWIEGGYRDLTNAYHDSVEECLVIEGELDLDGEGHFRAGDYFWRPPGFVHAASTTDGFKALLIQQGEDPGEASGPTSRRIRPDEEAGKNALYPDDMERAVGPRGWVLRTATSLLPWRPGPLFIRGEGPWVGGDIDQLDVKVLSRNPWTGAQTVLLRLHPGYRQTGAGRYPRAWEYFVLEGEVAIGDEPCHTGTYCRFESGSVVPPLASSDGATLFVKIDGPMERLPAADQSSG